jgi:hypothetical protein
MRATRAYIASAGTATVLLAASLAMFGLVSTIVAFGSWPGAGAGRQVDQVLLRDVVNAKPKPVAVGDDAVKAARRAAARREAVAQAGTQRTQRRAVAHGPAVRHVAKAPAGSTPAGTGTPAASGTPVAQAPTPAAPAPVKQQADNVGQTIDNTTRDIGNQVTQPVQTVTDPVGQVVDQVAAPVQQTAGPVVQQVQDTAGGVLPP